MVLHLIPFEFLNDTRSVDLDEADRDTEACLPPVGGLAGSRNVAHRFNFEGIQIVTESRSEKVSAYTQLFRCGIIESVDTRASGRNGPNVPEAFKDQLLWAQIRGGILNAVGRFLHLLRRLRGARPLRWL